MIRLQKYLAEAGVCARRKAEKMIVAGEVRVNGQIMTELGRRIDPANDRIEVAGQIIKPHPKGIILLHKPRGVVSTLHDPEGRRTVKDYLTKHYRSYFPVGRLDLDSSGLIILTNDGDLAERLLHPRYEIKKVYLCEVAGWVGNEIILKLEKGVKLEDGRAKAHVDVRRRSEELSLIDVTVAEGRNRLVRRLMESVGHKIISLKRLSHGPFKLGGLRAGEIKRLSEAEYIRFRRQVFNGK